MSINVVPSLTKFIERNLHEQSSAVVETLRLCENGAVPMQSH